MTTLNDHIQQAEHNKQFANELLNRRTHWDWAITAIFYTALHYIQASLIALEVNPLPAEHAERNDWVLKTQTNTCYQTYKDLYAASRKVRYLIKYSRNTAAVPSIDFYSLQDARDFYFQDLPLICTEIAKNSPAVFNRDN